MKMRTAGLLIALLVISGCLQTTAADGKLRCSVGQGRQCPADYYCAADSTCWHNGHEPSVAPSCSDGVRNADETDIDCGGSCPQCDTGKACSAAADCTTALCQMNVCATPPPECTNGAQDPGESDLDCGGPICPACTTGKTCGADADCITMMCNQTTHTCFDQCNDGQKDGDEADVDCGGSCKSKCVAPQSCGLPADCATGVCNGGYCIAASGPPNWIKVAEYPSGVDQYENQAAVGPDGKIYLIGGCINLSTQACGKIPYTSMVYDPRTNTLTDGISLDTQAEARAGGSATVVGNKLFLFGGYYNDNQTNASTAVTEVDAYDFSTKTWTTNVATIPSNGNMLLHPAITAGTANDILLFGGKLDYGQNPFLTLVTAFAPTTSMFDMSFPAMPYAVAGAGAALTPDGKAYVLLGACNGYSCPSPGDLNSVQIFDESTKAWAAYQKPLQLPTNRGYVGSALAGDGRIYVVGGQLLSSVATTATVEAYTPKTNNWATVASLNSAGMYVSASVGPDGRIYAIGGVAIDTAQMSLVFRSVIEAYGPVVALVSSHGSVGSSQGLTGSNFAANATVNVYFGNMATPVATAQTDGLGQIPGTLTYHVPNVAAGDYQIKAIDNKSAYPVYASFTVQ